MLSPRLVDARGMFGVPAAFWKSVAAPAIWSDMSLWTGDVLPLHSRPLPGPEMPAGSPRPREGLENHRADHIPCTVALLTLGLGGREFVLEGGGDYRRPAHGGNMDYLRGWIGDIPSRPAAINREGATVRISTSEAISRPSRHSEFKGTPQRPI